MRLTHEQFRELAVKHGLAVTHQRQVVYEAVIASHGHYSRRHLRRGPRRIPSISLATVCRLAVHQCGLLREVPPHRLRVDGNPNSPPPRLLRCKRCRALKASSTKRLSRHLPDGFDVTQPLIEVFGPVPVQRQT
jgi:Fur family peroxide stress response transcriptional regulator